MHQHRSKRRRWLIVVLVLVLVSMVTWWYWPRGDVRFVGKWHTDSEPLGTMGVITLTSDGMGSRSLGRSRTEHFPWAVAGDQFLLGKPARSTWWWLLSEPVSMFAGRQYFTGYFEYTIVEVGQSTLTL